MDLISIIVPVYKAEKYLKRCVDSLRNQTYTNLEIILVDDGSPDNSGKMCDTFAQEDSRIKVIHKENGGQSDARNVGIKNATGKYIGFIDSDDYIEKDMYEVLYNEIIQKDADISVVSNAMVRENGERINGSDSGCKYVYEGDEIIKQLLLHVTVKNYAWDKLYKKELLDNTSFIIGICYEDVPFMYEVMSKAKKVTYYDSVKYYYVKHRESVSATCSEKNVKDYLNAIINRFNKIKIDYPQLSTYNFYAIANTTTHAYYKVMLSDKQISNYENLLNMLKQNCSYIVNNIEEEVVSLFSIYQKACFYMLLNDEELFINFLRDRQRKNKSNTAS